MKTVADVMDQNPVTVNEGASLDEVLKVMREHELQGVPVVNSCERCVGIITESDLILSDEEADLHLPHFISLFGGVIFLESLKRFEARLKKALASNASDLMTPELLTVTSSTSVHQAGRLISEHGHNRLPVVDHGRLVGVITRLDILRELAAQ